MMKAADCLKSLVYLYQNTRLKIAKYIKFIIVLCEKLKFHNTSIVISRNCDLLGCDVVQFGRHHHFAVRVTHSCNRDKNFMLDSLNFVNTIQFPPNTCRWMFHCTTDLCFISENVVFPLTDRFVFNIICYSHSPKPNTLNTDEPPCKLKTKTDEIRRLNCTKFTVLLCDAV
jgi:hypothetical protein